MAPKKHELTVSCDHCESSGIILDPLDLTVGIVCVACSGRGYQLLSYTPFSGRKQRAGIKRVRRSGQGMSAFSSEPNPDAGVTYAEFLKGKQP